MANYVCMYDRTSFFLLKSKIVCTPELMFLIFGLEGVKPWLITLFLLKSKYNKALVNGEIFTCCSLGFRRLRLFLSFLFNFGFFGFNIKLDVFKLLLSHMKRSRSRSRWLLMVVAIAIKIQQHIIIQLKNCINFKPNIENLQ